MRSFTSYLEKSVRPEWREYYLDYVFLKSLLEKFAERRSRTTEFTDIQLIERIYPEAEINKSSEFNISFADFGLMTGSDDNDGESISSKCTFL